MNAATHPPVDAAVDIQQNSLAGARAWFAREGLSRPRRRRMLAGVCASFARRYDVNPIVVRVAAVFAITVLTPLAYIAAWILMPRDPAEVTAPQ